MESSFSRRTLAPVPSGLSLGEGPHHQHLDPFAHCHDLINFEKSHFSRIPFYLDEEHAMTDSPIREDEKEE